MSASTYPQRELDDGSSGLVNFLLISAAAHILAVVLAVWSPWKSGSLLDEISPQDTMEISLSDSAPPVGGGAPVLSAPAAPRAAAPEPAEPAAPVQPAARAPEPVEPPAPKAPAKAVVPSVDKAAVPLMTRERSLEDRKRLEKAERTKADKAVKEAAKPDKHETKPAVDEKSAKLKEMEDRLAQKLREAKEAIAMANKYSSEAGTRKPSGASGTATASGTPATSASGTAGGTGTGSGSHTGSLMAAADKVQRDAYESYRGQVKAAMTDNWEVMASLKSLDLQAIFRIEISPEGDVLSAKLSKSSGNRVFDEAVARSVSKVENVGIPPAGFPRIVNIVFDNRAMEQ